MPTDLLPFLLFSIATSGTPGPNNVMVSAAAANYGVRATAPLIMGISSGFAFMLLVVGVGLAGPLAADVRVHAALRWVGAAWMLWLAWQIATTPVTHVPGAGTVRAPLGFFGGALFQWVNPKAWLIALATAATYTTPEGSLLHQVAILALVSFVVCLPCVFFWAMLGAGVGRILGTPRRRRIFNVGMALLLVLSLVPLLVG